VERALAPDLGLIATALVSVMVFFAVLKLLLLQKSATGQSCID
jgi:hypothetical protein